MERVHTVYEFYDGPRTGIADYCGRPHYFSCQWDDAADDHGNIFDLSPIDVETLILALEQWDLWKKWEFAFHHGQVSEESHPGHGGRDNRYDELERLIQGRLSVLPKSQISASANFHAEPGSENLPPGVMRPLLVEWTHVA